MKKILIIAGYGNSLIWFRQDLIRSWLDQGCRVIAAAPGDEVAEKMNQLGTGYYKIPLQRTGLNPFTDLALLFYLAWLLVKEKPDLVFAYTIKPVIYGSLAAFLRSKCRVYSMITGLGFIFTGNPEKSSLLRSLIVGLYRIALRRNEKVFFQNSDDLEVFLSRQVTSKEKAVLVNGSGVNLDYFYPLPFPDNKDCFLLIARLLWEKGIKEYMEAAGMIREKYPRAKFMLLGWSFEQVPSAIDREQVEAWQREGVVEMYGLTDDVRPYLARAAVYVLPSYREGTPRTVLEAMASGRPVITTDAPGCRETVVDGLNGFLVPVGDCRTLAEAMEKFILQPGLAEEMGAASRRLAEDKYDVHQVNRVINRTMNICWPGTITGAISGSNRDV